MQNQADDLVVIRNRFSALPTTPLMQPKNWEFLKGNRKHLVRESGKWLVLGFILLAISLLLLVFGIIDLVKANQLQQSSAIATAQVTSEDTVNAYILDFSFSVPTSNGQSKEYTGSHYVSQSFYVSHPVGSKFDLKYLPSDPTFNQIAEDRYDSSNTLLFFVLGIMFLIFATVLLSWCRKEIRVATALEQPYSRLLTGKITKSKVTKMRIARNVRLEYMFDNPERETTKGVLTIVLLPFSRRQYPIVGNEVTILYVDDKHHTIV